MQGGKRGILRHIKRGQLVTIANQLSQLGILRNIKCLQLITIAHQHGRCGEILDTFKIFNILIINSNNNLGRNLIVVKIAVLFTTLWGFVAVFRYPCTEHVVGEVRLVDCDECGSTC